MKKTKMQFDHTFTADKNHRFLKKLTSLGFEAFPKMTEHPGGSKCRFLMFKQAEGSGLAYLEFVHRSKRPYKYSGLSFGVPSGLESYFRRIRRNKRLKAFFTHRNYDWKENSKDRLPGWNFVQFKSKPKECEVWITEYESRKKKRKKPSLKAHKNGAERIVGTEFDLSKKDWAFFESLLQVSLKEKIVLPCGTTMIFRLAKKTRQKSVVVAVKDLDAMNQKKHSLELASFDGQPALCVKNPNPKMWDLLLVQG